jgi:subtilisin family serine protease
MPGGDVIKPESAISRESLTSDTRFDVAAADSFDQLAGVATRDGTVRVIVTLQMRWAPGQLLETVERVSQADTIDARQQQVIGALGTAGYKVLHRYRYIPALALELDPAALASLRASGLAATVQLDELDTAVLSESVPLINAPDVWDLGYDGAGQSVAIVDTGVDSTHAFLSGRVVGEACFSSGGDCPGEKTSVHGPGSAAPCLFDTVNCPHGTHVAGIAAGYDSPGLSGVAPGADIVAVQVFSDVGGGAAAYTADQLAALEYVYAVRDTYNIASVNMSIGGTTTYPSACDTDVRKLAIDNLLGAGVATVIAAGNGYANDGVSAPGCISTAVTVASSTKADERSDFSNIGEMVDVIAPGSMIYSSVPGGWASYNGTSMAAPHVAGAWALLKEAKPSAGVEDILAAIKYSPVEIPAASWSIARLDVADALSRLDLPWPENDPFEEAVLLTSPISLSASTVRATMQSGEPRRCLDPSDGVVDNIGATVWYRLEPGYRTEMTIDTAGSDFDTILGLYEGATVDALTALACNDDIAGHTSARVSADVFPGHTYWVQASGSSGATGTLSLAVSDVGDISDPPTWPSATLRAPSIRKDQITLAWPAAVDDYGVAGYRVYLDGTAVKTTTATTATVAGLLPNTTYRFEVEAFDSGEQQTIGPAATFTTARGFIDTGGLIFEEDIDWLSGSGITHGCNPPANDRYCPDSYVTRGQMAAFLVRALGYADAGAGDYFVDDDGSVFEAAIDKLAVAAVTAGCNPPANDRFCPNRYVTRGQMAAFLVRALGLSDQGSHDFVDDDGLAFESSIEKLATAGITRGCNPPANDRFCPTSYVTRGQMAAFLRRAFG